MTAARLRSMQRWFAACVQHPTSAAAALRNPATRRLLARTGRGPGGVLADNPRLDAAGMLQVYQGGYLQRLVEVMQGDFGAVHFALGDEAFRALVARYLAAFPSRHPNLNQLGRHFPAFVRRCRRLPHRVFLAEVAALELASCIAFDAPEFTPLATQVLAGVPQDRWGEVRFRANPSVQLLAFRHPVDVFYQAWKDGKKPAVPSPAPSWLAVFRRDDRVWRHRLSGVSFRVLESLVAGKPLAKALAQAEHGEPVAEWFRGYASDGLFVDLRLGRTGSA